MLSARSVCVGCVDLYFGAAMVGYRRNLVPGGTYFFTVALHDRRADTLTTHIDLLRAAFRAAVVDHPFQINAAVILPEHLHMLVTLPEGDANFPLRWQRIKRTFTHAVRISGAPLERRDGSGRALWQRRYWEHTIRDAADFARHVHYIHFNPVRHGYVTRACDWPYSSLHRDIREGVVAADWAGGAEDCEGEFGERDGGAAR